MGQNHALLLFLGKKFKKLFSYLKSAPTYFLHSKNSRKKEKCLKLRAIIASWAFRNKNALFRSVLARIKNNLFCYGKWAPSNLSTTKILKKKKEKSENLGPNMPYLLIYLFLGKILKT